MSADAAERQSINLYSEYSLHKQLKQYIAAPGDRFEVPVEGKVVDLLRADGEIVEVQTGHLSQLKAKALYLAQKGCRVRIVYPVSALRHLRRLDPKTGELLSMRKSPKKESEYDLFGELVHAPELIAARGVTVEALVITSVETKTRDGSGSWWRRGDRTVDKELVEVLSSRSFCGRDEWLALIPKQLAPPWDSQTLGAALGIESEKARKILYCLCRAGLIAELPQNGRRKAYGPA